MVPVPAVRSRPILHVVPALALCGLVLSVAGCRAADVSATSADATPPPGGAAASTAQTADTSPAADTSAAAGGQGTGGPGSLTVAITSPVAVSGHANTAVSCSEDGRRYVESSDAQIDGRTIAQSVRVAGYQGPGSYPGLVTVSVSVPGERYAVEAVPTTVQLTATGGSVDFSASTEAGRTLAGAITWACSV